MCLSKKVTQELGEVGCTLHVPAPYKRIRNRNKNLSGGIASDLMKSTELSYVAAARATESLVMRRTNRRRLIAFIDEIVGSDRRQLSGGLNKTLYYEQTNPLRPPNGFESVEAGQYEHIEIHIDSSTDSDTSRERQGNRVRKWGKCTTYKKLAVQNDRFSAGQPPASQCERLG